MARVNGSNGRFMTARKDLPALLEMVSPEPNTGCWLWTGAVSHRGYGRVWLHGKDFRAHRAVWLASGRTIVAGLDFDHLCRQPGCVNPDHLEQVSGIENQRRKASAHTECPRGHDLTGPNAYHHRGRRNCRECCREASRRYEAKSGRKTRSAK